MYTINVSLYQKDMYTINVSLYLLMGIGNDDALI
jgi:hypothetical protein